MRKARFASHPSSGGTPLQNHPYESLLQLQAALDALWASAVAPSTKDAYTRAHRLWVAFVTAHGLDPFPAAESLALFVAHRSSRVVPQTILGDLAGIAFHFRAIDEAAWERARSSWQVRRALGGNARANPHAAKKAVPLEVADLLSSVSSAVVSGGFDGLLWAAMASIAFLCCARAQELTEYDSPRYRLASKASQRGTLRLTQAGFSLDLPYHKADPLFTGSKLWYSRVDAGHLHFVIAAYVEARDRRFGRSGPMWLNAQGDRPLRRWFVDQLKARAGSRYTGHSFRAGGASWHAQRGTADQQIRCIGRWKSAAWEDYVRLQPQVAEAQRARDRQRLAPLPDPALPLATLAML